MDNIEINASFYLYFGPKIKRLLEKKLLRDLNNLQIWEQKWSLEFNPGVVWGNKNHS